MQPKYLQRHVKKVYFFFNMDHYLAKEEDYSDFCLTTNFPILKDLIACAIDGDWPSFPEEPGWIN